MLGEFHKINRFIDNLICISLPQFSISNKIDFLSRSDTFKPKWINILLYIHSMWRCDLNIVYSQCSMDECVHFVAYELIEVARESAQYARWSHAIGWINIMSWAHYILFSYCARMAHVVYNLLCFFRLFLCVCVFALHVL